MCSVHYRVYFHKSTLNWTIAEDVLCPYCRRRRFDLTNDDRSDGTTLCVKYSSYISDHKTSFGLSFRTFCGRPRLVYHSSCGFSHVSVVSSPMFQLHLDSPCSSLVDGFVYKFRFYRANRRVARYC